MAAAAAADVDAELVRARVQAALERAYHAFVAKEKPVFAGD